MLSYKCEHSFAHQILQKCWNQYMCCIKVHAELDYSVILC